MVDACSDCYSSGKKNDENSGLLLLSTARILNSGRALYGTESDVRISWYPLWIQTDPKQLTDLEYRTLYRRIVLFDIVVLAQSFSRYGR
jgi:hypothetical protein